MNNPTLRQLEIFLAMSVSTNLAEAAESLGVSQAAVSKSLKALERETGLTLFRNRGGRLEQTRDAHQLLPHVQSAMRQVELARLAAFELRGGAVGSIRVGVAGPAMMSIIPGAVKEFRTRWPEVRIEITSLRTSTLLNRVATGDLDIGIGTPPVTEFDAILLKMCDIRTICESDMVAVMPATHPLAARNFVRATDLANETLIGLPDDSATTHLIQAAFLQARVTPNTPIITSLALNGCGLIRAGLGICLMNRMVVADNMFRELVYRPFVPRVSLRTCTYIPKLNDRSDLALRFEECAKLAVEALRVN